MTTEPVLPVGAAAVRRIRLTYADTDAATILYFGAWFPWMERLSVEWAYDQGFRFDQMLDAHGASPVTRATSCEYLAAATVYDEIDIVMSVDEIGASSYRLGFAMTLTATGVLVARAALTLVFVDASGRATAVPAAYRAVLEATQA